MGKQKTNHLLIKLLILYVILAAMRFVFACCTSSHPTLTIDEFLYFNLGRSIAAEGELLFRGQRADYGFILYPLILSPIYLLFNEGAHFFRLIQLWNIIIMNASVFPLFYLSRAVLKSEKKAFIITAVSMLLPDLILGQIIFSESVIYPLFFTLMYCVFQYIQRNEGKYLLWGGLIGGLLYSVKPGAVTPAAVFFMMALFNTIRSKERKARICFIEAVLIMTVTISGFMMLARFGFGYRGTVFSIYESQMGQTYGWNPGRFFRALFIYPYYFILACGIIGFAYPVYCFHRWTAELKTFWRFLIISLGVMSVGAAWSVERVSPFVNISLRYVAMYIPVVLLFCCVQGSARSAESEKSGKPRWLPPVIMIGFVMLCTVFLGCKAGAQTNEAYAQMSLSLLNSRILPVSKQTTGSIIILVFCAALLFLFIKNPKKLNYGKISMVFITIFMLINNILGYSYIHENYRPDYEKNGLEVSRLTQGGPYIYLLPDRIVTDKGIDVNTKGINNFVYYYDFMNNIQRHNGVYAPYIPEMQRGMADVHETPDVDTLVLDIESFPMVKFSEFTTVTSVNGKGQVYVVKFTPGKRLTDSCIGNVDRLELDANRTGILFIYDEDMLDLPLTVRLDIESKIPQPLTMNSTQEMNTIELSEGRSWYEINFKKAEDAFNFIVPDRSIKLYSYELVSSGG